MWSFVEAFTIGWAVGVVCVVLYIRGRLLERWYVSGRDAESGYEVVIKKGRVLRVMYRVKYDRRSSPNPDTRFADQLRQARADAIEKAESLNTHERLARDHNRRSGTPGGIT